MGDLEKFAFMVEGAELIAHTTDRYAVFEELYLRTQSAAVTRLKGSLTTLYAAVLKYLAKAKHYFEERTALRVMKSSFASKGDIEQLSDSIASAQCRVNEYAALVDAEHTKDILENIAILNCEHKDKYRQLKVLLEDIDAQSNVSVASFRTLRMIWSHEEGRRSSRGSRLSRMSRITTKTEEMS